MTRTPVEKIKIFLEMIKFEHSIFALPFAYLGLVLARETNLWIWFAVTVVMISFRTMAMAINRIIDAAIDGQNPRTQSRAIPAGLLSGKAVWGAVFVSFLIFEFTTYLLGTLCFSLSPIPVLLAFLYPYAKRFTWFSHLILGIILGIAPYGAWVASQGSFSWVPGFLMVGVTAWVAGFDMIYALQDVEFDRQVGLFSFPARFGENATVVATRALHFLTVLAWAAAGWAGSLGVLYFLGIGIATFFLIREHWLVQKFGLKRLEEAFFGMNAFISLSVFFMASLDVLIWR